MIGWRASVHLCLGIGATRVSARTMNDSATMRAGDDLAVGTVSNRTGWLTFDHALDHTALARLCANNTLTGRCRAFLDIARLRFHGLRLCLRRLVRRGIRDRGFGNVYRTTCKDSTARSSRGQFRQGHFYRHGQTLLLLHGSIGERRVRFLALPVTTRDATSS